MRPVPGSENGWRTMLWRGAIWRLGRTFSAAHSRAGLIVQPCKSGHCEYGVFEGPDLVVGALVKSVLQSRVVILYRDPLI